MKNMLNIAGVVFLCLAFILSVYNLSQIYGAGDGMNEACSELSARIDSSGLPVDYPEEVIPDYLLNPDMEMPTEEIDGLDYIGKVVFPGYGKEFPVVSEWSYPNLDVAPCRYSGSAYQNDLILFAHNYPGQFDFLKSMVVGDSVSFTDVDGNEFRYQVKSIDTLKPSQTDELESGNWDLTLFTCTSTGTARIVLRCELVDD